MRLLDGKFKITRHCHSCTAVSLQNFFIELGFLGSENKTGEILQAAHYKTYHLSYGDVPAPAQSRNPESEQETKQTKTDGKEENLQN